MEEYKKHAAKHYGLTFSAVDTACSTKYHRVGDYLFYYYDDTQGAKRRSLDWQRKV